MIRKIVLPLIAVAMLGFAVAHALYIQRPEPQSPPPVPPPGTPFGDTVAGAGMVEASSPASGTGNIAIGSQLAGVVTKVWVRMDQEQEVKAGDLLFELDPRQTRADLAVREANVPVSEAQVVVAETTCRQTKDQYERALKILGTGAVAPQDVVAYQQAYESAVAQLALAKANTKLVRVQIEQDKTMLDLLQVRAPVDGTILQVNVRPGEYISTSGGQALIVMGNLHPLHVRVNVDEEDIPRLKLFAPARAKIRGDVRQEEVLLTFVRLEPYVVPKTSLTGANTERVDTRVIQVIYAVDPGSQLVREKKLLVGQLVDVFIDTRASSQSNKYPPDGAP